MNDVLETISSVGILPVIKISDSSQAVGLAKALCAGSIPVAEITFRTAAAEEAIHEIAQKVPEVCVGAGTVLTVEQAEAAVAAGARFVVSPGFSPAVVGWCIQNKVPVVPGCATPTEVEAALGFGLEVLKFFPAEAAGGIPMLKSLASPYSRVKFIPTGGVTPETLNRYLSLSNVVACGGSWMVPESLLDSGDFAQITALCKTAVLNMLDFAFSHVEISAPSEQEAAQAATALGALFALPVTGHPEALFAGTAVAVRKAPMPGALGLLAFSTRDLKRAAAYLERSGVCYSEKSIKGEPPLLYLKNQISGYAVCLRQK